MDDLSKLTFMVRDEYQREPVAKNILKLLSADISVSPMIIDGGWGTGKTEFCYKLINMIEAEVISNPTFTAVYIDAFKADHADNPLMTVLAAILAKFPEDKGKNLKEKALPFLKFGLKTTGKAAVSWILKQDATQLVDDIDKVLEKAGSVVTDSGVKALLDGHMKADKDMKALSVALAELAKTQPIILFIDELDRCRPDFAVSMLETIKHVFDVSGVQFVLITNTDQLKASINHCYGLAVDAQRYLDKFIGYSFALPSNHSFNYKKVQNSYRHFRSGVSSTVTLKESILTERNEWVSGLLQELFVSNSLSLRETETFLKYLEIYQILTNSEGLKEDLYSGYALLRVFSILLFSLKKGIQQGVNKHIVDFVEVKKVLGKEELVVLEKDEYGEFTVYPEVTDMVFALLASDHGSISEEWEELLRKTQFFGIGRRDVRNDAIIKEVFNTLELS